MIKLFEITTGWHGESYERCYAWAANEAAARDMFYDHLVHKSGNPPDERSIQEVTLLFSGDDKPFITELADYGFGEAWGLE